MNTPAELSNFGDCCVSLKVCVELLHSFHEVRRLAEFPAFYRCLQLICTSTSRQLTI